MGLTDYSRMDKEFYLAGIRAEKEARYEWLNRVRTWYPEKADAWMEGYETAETRIIKLLEAHAETYLTTKEAIERDLSEDWHTGFTDAIALFKGEN